MFIISCWNIWGLNGPQKQKNVQFWAQKNNLDIFGILETKITAANITSVQATLAPPYWQFYSNINSNPTCRILVGWNPHKLQLICLHSSPQWLTCEATHASLPHPIKITFIYGHNTPAERHALWHYITRESSLNTCIPWLVMGDFNAIMQTGDRIGGNIHWPRHQDDFVTCISQSALLQVPYTGIKYSWHNGQHGCNTIQKKLDWVFDNSCLFSSWPATNATFEPRSISDHSAMIIRLRRPNQHSHSPFKFLNIWTERSDFLTTVASSWQAPVIGNPMFQFTTKLRRLKSVLRKIHLQFTNNITDRVARSKTTWEDAQFYLDAHPTSDNAKIIERSSAAQYLQLCKEEESYFKQKSRIQWLQLGDKNTSFFHKSLLHRQVRNVIHNLQDDNGTLVHDPEDIGKLTSIYFENLLTATHPTLNTDITDIFPNTITEDYPLRTLTATGLPWNARVADIITAGQWDFPRDVPTLNSCWNSITFLPNPNYEDNCEWKGQTSGVFSIKSAWELLRDKRPVNNMHQLLWFKGHIPRQSFILWLAGLERLRTMDRLHSAGIIQNTSCSFCGTYTESHEHLFFECQIPRSVWQMVNARANITWPCMSWKNLLQWASTIYIKKSDVQHTIARLLLSTTVYQLWYERNNRVFNNQHQNTQNIAEAVFQQVRMHITAMEFSSIIPASICDVWGIQQSPTNSSPNF
uniref:Uncharacterized protein n=1 Tax=Populus alba TaxID=43335 RepID=A0A4U5QSR9_POPAL|nr:hypothetical protein D5086_0000062540 [Populus alba]